MKLYFTAGTKDVPTKTMISRKLLTTTAPHVDRLREAGRNKALNVAIMENPAVVSYLTGDWIEAKRKEYSEAYPGAGDKFINEHVQKALAAALTEEFPAVFKAITNPVTDIDFDNDDAVNAACTLCRVIIDTSVLSGEEIAQLDSDGFWDEQDLQEVVDAVNRFRAAAKL